MRYERCSFPTESGDVVACNFHIFLCWVYISQGTWLVEATDVWNAAKQGNHRYGSDYPMSHDEPVNKHNGIGCNENRQDIYEHGRCGVPDRVAVSSEKTYEGEYGQNELYDKKHQ